jgi:hypothetical protein
MKTEPSAARVSSLILTLALLCCRCGENTAAPDPSPPGVGLRIYAANVAHTGDLSYQHFDVDTVTLSDTPLIAYDEILTYDTAGHVLTLTMPRDSVLVPGMSVYGSAFVVTLDGDRLYGGFFWMSFSSIPCYVPIILLDTLFNPLLPNQIRIARNYADPDTTSPDPRHNAALFARLAADGKAR